MTAEIIQISGITLASVVAINIHFHNKKLERIKAQLENLYLKLNYIIETDYKFLQMNTPDDEDKDEILKKYASDYLNFFEKLRNCYLENMLYSSAELKRVFNLVNFTYNRELRLVLKYKNIDILNDAKKEVAIYLFVTDKRFIKELDEVIEVISNDIYLLQTNNLLKTYMK
ncbi:MAG: hypothetical protein PHD79_04280 [Aliarcobacter sp.]|jgi:hypothetical protein|nr:hypothetical protein [Aliarcobacter sp.]